MASASKSVVISASMAPLSASTLTAAAPPPTATAAAPIDEAALSEREWLDAPTPLIALMGTNELQSPIVQNIPNTHSMRYLRISYGHYFPKAKPKRVTGYEQYEPAGIIKTGWTHKHKHVIPAVVVVLMEWDDSKQWDLQEATLASAINRYMANNPGRDTRVVAVVVKHRAPSDDEKTLTDTFGRMAKKVGLESSKNIFLLLTADFRGALKRLETVLYDHATEYYRAEVKKIKNYKHKVSAVTQQSLYVRHHYKIGFYNEMILDIPAALKYYTSAYLFLNQIKQKAEGAYAVEVRAVAFLINFKITRLLLSGLLPRTTDALDQFNSHLANYKSFVGVPKLAFYHHQWMAQQYNTFGDQIDLLQNQARAAAAGAARVRPTNYVRLQNAGYFYSTAASFATKRKQTYTALMASDPTLHRPKEAGAAPIAAGFFGQAPGVERKAGWSTSIEDDLLLKFVLRDESSVDHSAQVISLLMKSYECFKRESKSPRTTLQIASAMAAEYYSAANYEMAKQFYHRIAKTYRTDQWWSILTNVLLNSYDCARKLELNADLIRYGLELLASYSVATPARKETIQSDIFALIQAKAAPTDPIYAVPYPLEPAYDLITCRAVWKAPTGSVYLNESVDLCLTVKASFPLRFTFSKVAIQLTDPTYNITILPNASSAAASERKTAAVSMSLSSFLDDAKPKTTAAAIATSPDAKMDSDVRYDDLTFNPRETKVLTLAIRARTPAAVPLQCVAVLFYLTRHESISSLATAGTPQPSLVLHCPCIQPTEDETGADSSASALSQSSVRIVAARPKASLKVAHPQPALIAEYYPLSITVSSDIHNVESGSISLGSCRVKVITREEDKKIDLDTIDVDDEKAFAAEQADAKDDIALDFFTRSTNAAGVESFEPLPTIGSPTAVPTLNLPALSSMNTHTVTVFARCTAACERQVTVKLSYQNASVPMSFEHTFVLGFVAPFAPKFRVFSHAVPTHTSNLRPSRLEDRLLAVSKPAVLNVELDNPNVHRLRISSIELQSSICSSDAPERNVSVDLCRNERYSAAITLVPHLPAASASGSRPAASALLVRWSRVDSAMNERTLISSRDALSAAIPALLDVDLKATSKSATAAGDDSNEKEPDSPTNDSLLDAKQQPSQRASAPVLVTGPAVVTRLELPFLSADRLALPSQSPFEVAINCPASVPLGSPFDVFVSIALVAPPSLPGSGRSTAAAAAAAATAGAGGTFCDLQITIADADANSERLSISGLRSGAIRLLPNTKHTLAYKIVALECGVVALPRIGLRAATAIPGVVAGGALIVDPNDFGFVTVTPRPVLTS